MKSTLFTFLVLSLLTPKSFAYYGSQSTEAMLSFETTADVLWNEGATDSKADPTKTHFKRTHKALRKSDSKNDVAADASGVPTFQELNAPGALRNKAIDLVELQIEHLMGTFQSASFLKVFKYAGVLGEQQNYPNPDYPNKNYQQENYNIEFTDVKQSETPGRLMLKYKFNGKTVFNKDAFSKGTDAVLDVPLKLPLSADLIYQQSMGKKGKKDFNFCTDEFYNDEGDFWYFWDPEQDNCMLNGNTTLIQRPTGKLTIMENSTDTFPDYNKLYSDNGNKKNLNIVVLLGYVDTINNNLAPHKKDTTYANYIAIYKDLENKGYKLTTRKDGFRVSSGGKFESKGADFLREYTKSIVTKNKQSVDVKVQIVLADTDIASTDNTFHYFLVPAFENADILIYDGHSGLGGNLDLASFPQVKFKNKYQIFFFNGCSSYSYYNGMFFSSKGGSENIDIVNSGLETSSDSTARNAFTFMKFVLAGQLPSYEFMLGALENSNYKVNGTYLTGVSGEKDNTYKPDTSNVTKSSP